MTGASEDRLVLIASAERSFHYPMVRPPAAKAAHRSVRIPVAALKTVNVLLG